MMAGKIHKTRRNGHYRRRKNRVYRRNGDILIPVTHRVVPAGYRNGGQTGNGDDEDWPLFGSQIRHTIAGNGRERENRLMPIEYYQEKYPWFGSQIRYTIDAFRYTIREYKRRKAMSSKSENE